jgi:hypothetical protein
MTSLLPWMRTLRVIYSVRFLRSLLIAPDFDLH